MIMIMKIRLFGHWDETWCFSGDLGVGMRGGMLIATYSSDILVMSMSMSISMSMECIRLSLYYTTIPCLLTLAVVLRLSVCMAGVLVRSC